MVKNTKQSEQQQKAISLIGLALQEDTAKKNLNHDKSAIDCPDGNMISAYCEGHLSTIERENFRNIILQCPESYSLWMEMELQRDQWQYHEQYEKKTNPAVSFYHWMIRPLHLSSAFGVVSAVLLVSFLLRPILNPVKNKPQLNESFDIISTYSAQNNDFRDLFLSSQSQSSAQMKGFSTFINPHLLAFKNGLEQAQQKIQNYEKKQDKQLVSSCFNAIENCLNLENLYQYIGSWAILTRVSCQLESVKLNNNQYSIFLNWHKQWKSKLQSPTQNSGLDSRLEQLKLAIQKKSIHKKDVCQMNNELVRFALLK